MESKKFYWLKLRKDFFKRHDIKIIEDMPNGFLISHFYLKLMLESIDHEGELRFSKTKPYTPEMLASVFNMNAELVKTALKTLEEFELIKITKNGTIIVEKVMSMVGYETEWARKKALWREQKKEDNERTNEGQSEDNVLQMSSECPHDVLLMSDKSKSKRQSKSKSKSKESIERKTPSFTIPTVEEVRAYCQERGNSIDPEAFVAFYDSKGWKVGREPMRNWKSAVITWEKRSKPVKKEETFADLIEKWEEEDG